MRIWIQFVKIGIDNRFVPVLFRIPFPGGTFRIPGGWIRLALCAFVQGDGFIHHPVIQENGTRMADRRSKVPVAAYHFLIGIIRSEQAVLHPVHPDAAFMLFPAGQRLCPGNHSAQRFLGAVNNTGVFPPSVPGSNLFPVDTGSNNYLVTGLGDPRRIVDVFERAAL